MIFAPFQLLAKSPRKTACVRRQFYAEVSPQVSQSEKRVFSGSATMLQVDDGATRTENVTGLDKYTEYEFQVLAFTSGGDGPKSSVKVERTEGELIQY